MKNYFSKHPVFAALFGFALLFITASLIHSEATKNGFILANTFLTTQLIAREALIRLRNFLVMRGLVYTDYSNTFQKQGDTIRVKKPPVYVADEFGGTINLQSIGEDSVNVTLSHLADVSVSWGSKERALNIDDFNQQVLDPAMEAIAQKIDADLYKEFYKDVPFFVGTSGTTPSKLDDFAAAALMLTNNKVPLSNRVGVWDPTAHSKFSILDAIVNAEKSGSTQALREGSIGRIQGMDNYMTQNVQTHTAGTFTAVAAPKVKTKAVKASNTLILKGGAGTETLLAGDVFYITTGGVKYYYAVAEDADAAAGDISVKTVSKVQAEHAVDDVVTFPDKTAGGHKANLAFVKNACAFVSRPLEAPMGAAQAYTVNFEGISLRVVAGYDINKKEEILSIDTLYGIKAVYPELATRVLG
ncbi:MAG: P22 phage major capsid protein family protein [Acidobacteriota bacterium]